MKIRLTSLCVYGNYNEVDLVYSFMAGSTEQYDIISVEGLIPRLELFVDRCRLLRFKMPEPHLLTACVVAGKRVLRAAFLAASGG